MNLPRKKHRNLAQGVIEQFTSGIRSGLLKPGEKLPGAFIARLHHEHEEILRAIERQDPEGARAAMRTHLSNSRERLRRAQETMSAECLLSFPITDFDAQGDFSPATYAKRLQ